MGALTKIPMVQLAIVVSTVTALAWITLPGTAALVISIAATGVLALRGVSEADKRDDGENAGDDG